MSQPTNPAAADDNGFTADRGLRVRLGYELKLKALRDVGAFGLEHSGL